jgi:hypothetical protein
MAHWIKRLKAAETPLHDFASRMGRGGPILDGWADGLVQVIQRVFHKAVQGKNDRHGRIQAAGALIAPLPHDMDHPTSFKCRFN